MDFKIAYEALSASNKEALDESIMDMGITTFGDLMQASEVAKTFICEASMVLTFTQFRGSRKAVTFDRKMCEDLGLSKRSAEAFLYNGGCFILIEGPGQFYLIIGTSEWRSNDLESLEQLLYDKWYA